MNLTTDEQAAQQQRNDLLTGIRTLLAEKYQIGDLTDRIQGNTVADLEADAKNLAEKFGASARPKVAAQMSLQPGQEPGGIVPSPGAEDAAAQKGVSDYLSTRYPAPDLSRR